VARLSGLGKGLGALIPPDTTAATTADPDGGARLEDVPIASISPNPQQPRLHFDEESMADLASSIRQIGVLQPVLVRPVDGGYELIAGERRWRAARRAGLAVIPAVIRSTDDQGAVERALIENLHRQDLTPLEEAAAYQQLIDEFELTHEQVATRVGKSRSAVTNTLRLMSLPATVQHLLADGRLSAGHAKALLSTPDRSFQERLAAEAVAGNWSVRMLEEAIRSHASATAPPRAAEEPAAVTTVSGRGQVSSLRAPGLLEVEELLDAAEGETPEELIAEALRAAR